LIRSVTINTSMFHGEHPAFPYLLPGTTTPMQAKRKSMFNRKCFQFIYAVTANITDNDNPAFFYHLFDLQCVVGDKEKCSRWSDELLQAIRKKMGVVKLLGKDGHIGRSKKRKHSTDEEFEAHLPPTLTGITSYANWCNEIYKDLTNSTTIKEQTDAMKAMTLKANNQAQMKTASGAAKVATRHAMQTKAKELDGGIDDAASDAVAQDGCFCIHRGAKEVCHCDESQKQGTEKHVNGAAVKVKESSEPVPFKGTASKIKGLDIAEQMSTASNSDKGMDDVEALMHKARENAERAAERRAAQKKGNLKKKAK